MPRNSQRYLEIQQNLYPCISLKGRPLIACPKGPTYPLGENLITFSTYTSLTLKTIGAF